jgi:hypothetical protein
VLRTPAPLNGALGAMRKFFSQPRSILGAMLWGMAGAIAMFVLLIIGDFAVSLYTGKFGPVKTVEAISVGNGFSIAIKATPAHPWFAEYFQSVRIFGGEPRLGDLLGEVEIPMNTGGRVRIGILIPRTTASQVIGLVDRHSTSWIDLKALALMPSKRPAFEIRDDHPMRIVDWNWEEYRALGWISGASYPLKFIPCVSWVLLSDDEKQSILENESVFSEFCDERH